MKRIVAVTVVVLSCLASGFGPKAGAQTFGDPPVSGTPTLLATPTSTVDPVLASPDELLAAAAIAQENQGTAHFTAKFTILIPGGEKMTQLSHGSQSFRKHTMHSYDVVRHVGLGAHAGTSSVIRTESISDQHHFAERRNSGPWTCTKLLATQQSSAFAAALGAGALATTRFADPALVTERGISAWHILESIDLPGITPKGRPILEEDYVSQSDHTLVLMRYTGQMEVPSMRNGTVTMSAISQSGEQAFSQYGVPTSITMPATCRGASVGPADVRPLFAIVQRLLRGGFRN